MYVMKPADKRELEAYRALGTVEELTARLASPYPQADEGFAPLPPLTRFSKPDFQDGQFSGLLTDDDIDPDWDGGL